MPQYLSMTHVSMKPFMTCGPVSLTTGGALLDQTAVFIADGGTSQADAAAKVREADGTPGQRRNCV
jgi:hypothetical protein